MPESSFHSVECHSTAHARRLAGPTKVAWKNGTRTVGTENFEEGVKRGGTKRSQLEWCFSAGKF
ncbi:MAG TPA: hypothetical protein VFI05_01375, partial [Nitrospiraceae bacterium]|nr:hypothetical protein [Nitrospiraceae bacterium]